MKELRELYDKGTQGKWEQDIINITKETFGVSAENDDVIASCGGDDGDYNAQLIAAMHNALPELLDAWEKWSAIMFAKEQACGTCPMNLRGDRTAETCGMCDVSLFDCLPEWTLAWRDAQKNEGVE